MRRIVGSAVLSVLCVMGPLGGVSRAQAVRGGATPGTHLGALGLVVRSGHGWVLQGQQRAMTLFWGPDPRDPHGHPLGHVACALSRATESSVRGAYADFQRAQTAKGEPLVLRGRLLILRQTVALHAYDAGFVEITAGFFALPHRKGVGTIACTVSLMHVSDTMAGLKDMSAVVRMWQTFGAAIVPD